VTARTRHNYLSRNKESVVLRRSCKRLLAPIAGVRIVRSDPGTSGDLNRVHARSWVMRAVLFTLALGLLLSPSVGCFTPAYSGDPARRTQQLIFTSENLRLLLDDWERIWFLDQPSHLTPYRTHGGII
jgi:hypothetical protein